MTGNPLSLSFSLSLSTLQGPRSGIWSMICACDCDSGFVTVIVNVIVVCDGGSSSQWAFGFGFLVPKADIVEHGFEESRTGVE